MFDINSIQTIPAEKYDTFLDEYRADVIHPSKKKEVFLTLRSHFSTVTPELIAQHYQTYWRAYIELTWSQFQTFSIDEFVSILKAQLPFVLYLDIPIQEHIFYFAYRVLVDGDLQQEFFAKLQGVFQAEDMYLNPLASTPIVLQTLRVPAIKSMNSQDSLERTEYIQNVAAKLRNPDLHFLYIDVLDSDVAEQMLELVLFFSQNRDMEQVSYEFFEEVDRDLEIMYQDDFDSPEEDENFDLTRNQTKSTQDIETLKVTESSSSEVDTSYTTLQAHILETYGDISTKAPEEMTPVFEYLQTQAEEMEDDTVTQLIIFDAESGQFVWNKELLV